MCLGVCVLWGHSKDAHRGGHAGHGHGRAERAAETRGSEQTEPVKGFSTSTRLLLLNRHYPHVASRGTQKDLTSPGPSWLGMRIDKILTIPIPYRFLLIDSIPYQFSYRFLFWLLRFPSLLMMHKRTHMVWDVPLLTETYIQAELMMIWFVCVYVCMNVCVLDIGLLLECSFVCTHTGGSSAL